MLNCWFLLGLMLEDSCFMTVMLALDSLSFFVCPACCRWDAPETISNREHSFASDMYMLATAFFEMFVGEPWCDLPPSAIIAMKAGGMLCM